MENNREVDIRKWNNNADRWKNVGDYDVFDEIPCGTPYSDDELRAKFREGVTKLENKGDYDLLMIYGDNGANKEAVKIFIWKALNKMKIHSENLTGRQLIGLYEILKSEIRNEDCKS